MSDTVPDHLSSVACVFTRGYLEAAFFSVNLGGDPEEGEADEMSGDHGVGDLSPEAWKAVRRDCDAFLAANRDLIEACEDVHRPADPDDTALSHAGRDFWYTREGHGAGFWDGDWPDEAGSHLTAASKAFGRADWYIGDDDRIWQMGDENFRQDRVPVLAAPPAYVFPSEAPSPAM